MAKNKLTTSEKDASAKVKKTAAEKIASIDAKIEDYQSQIAVLTAKKESILNPKPKLTVKLIMEKAKASGLSPEDMAKKLGIEI